MDKLQFSEITNLNGFKFVLKLRHQLSPKVVEISNRIYSLEGSITFRISTENYLIVERQEDLFSKDFRGILNDFDEFLILENRQTKILTNKSNGMKEGPKILKVVILSEMEKILMRLEPVTIEYHYENGLPLQIEQESVISLIDLNSKINNRINFHSFTPLIQKSNFRNNLDYHKYDFPTYFPNANQRNSIFATNYEMNLLMNKDDKLNNNDVVEKVSQISNLRKNNLVGTLNFSCFLCRIRYSNYDEHVNSETHINSCHKEEKSFDLIRNELCKLKMMFESQKRPKKAKLKFRFNSKKIQRRKKGIKISRRKIILRKIETEKFRNAKSGKQQIFI